MAIMQKLRDYLTENNITRRDFAAKIGVDQSVLSRFCNDLARPSLDTAFSIERETAGAVPASYWVSCDTKQTPAETTSAAPTSTPNEDAA